MPDLFRGWISAAGTFAVEPEVFEGVLALCSSGSEVRDVENGDLFSVFDITKGT